MAKNNPPAPAGRPARGAQDIAAKRVQNSKSSVNKLSPEVLSHIFLAGEEEERGSRKRSVAYSYIGFQELASVSCSNLGIFTVLNICDLFAPYRSSARL